MARFPVFSLGGLNLKVSPLLQNPGELTRSVNVDSYPIGGKRKRAGYTTYLGTTPNGGEAAQAPGIGELDRAFS